jgi:predicted site-specific integrase-resolvase
MPRQSRPKIEGYDDQTAAILIGISRRTLLRHLKSGLLSPPALMMGKNRRAWRENDIQHAKTQLRENLRARPRRATWKSS